MNDEYQEIIYLLLFSGLTTYLMFELTSLIGLIKGITWLKK